MNKTCSTCKYFEKSEKVGFFPSGGKEWNLECGKCHLYPPSHVEYYDGNRSYYQRVHQSDWCSFWSERE